MEKNQVILYIILDLHIILNSSITIPCHYHNITVILCSYRGGIIFLTIALFSHVLSNPKWLTKMQSNLQNKRYDSNVRKVLKCSEILCYSCLLSPWGCLTTNASWKRNEDPFICDPMTKVLCRSTILSMNHQYFWKLHIIYAPLPNLITLNLFYRWTYFSVSHSVINCAVRK